jgi:hypothetical protein
MTVCGHIWSDSSNTALHQQHVCGEEKTRGQDHVHVCSRLDCGAAK